MVWKLGGDEVGLVSSSNDALELLDQWTKARARLCKKKDSLYRVDSIIRYVSSPNMVRDIIPIIDVWNAWINST
jgi:hypothetical protein